jgi:hypothetical protein
MALAVATACAGRPAAVVLPQGLGQPLDASALDAERRARASTCALTGALVADLRVSGRVDGERVRGTLQIGVDADAIRIEALPPMGAPVFILAGHAAAATLLLPRDRAYVEAPVAALTEAVVGIALAPADLRAVLAGCGVAGDDIVGGRTFGQQWVRVELASDSRLWLWHDARGHRLLVAETGQWRVEYLHEHHQPVRGVLRHATAPTALSFTVEAPEWLDALPAGATDVIIRDDALPIALDQLRRQRALGAS